MLYSLERFFVEQLRTDSLLAGPSELVMPLKAAGYDPASVPGVLHIGDFLIWPFRTAQFISLIAFIAGLIMYIVLKHIDAAGRSRLIEKEIISNSEKEASRQQSTIK